MNGPIWDSDSWLEEESRFNHDWLGNGLIVNLRAVEAAIKFGDLTRLVFERTLECLKQWHVKKANAKLLVDRVSECLCYSRFFHLAPLIQISDQTRIELQLIVAEIWQQKVTELGTVKSAKGFIAQLDRSIAALVRCYEWHQFTCIMNKQACTVELTSALAAAEKLSHELSELSRLAHPS